MVYEQVKTAFENTVEAHSVGMDEEKAKFFKNFALSILGLKILNELNSFDSSYDDQRGILTEKLSAVWDYADDIGIKGSISMMVSEAAQETARILLRLDQEKAKKAVEIAEARVELIMQEGMHLKGSR